jgi:hypothetical protein
VDKRELTVAPVGGIGTVSVPRDPVVTTTRSAAVTPYTRTTFTAEKRTAFTIEKRAAMPLRSNVRRRGSSRQIRAARTRRTTRTVGSRGDPSRSDDDSEPEPVARLDGFAVASRRMHVHLCRRTGKAAAA